MSEEIIVYRVTTLKANGSVWTKSYDDIEKLVEVLPLIVDKFPHIILSKQTLKQSPLDYLASIGDKDVYEWNDRKRSRI